MIYLLLAILCSAAISLIMRLSSSRVQAKMSMLCTNYLVCLLLAAIYSGFSLSVPGKTLGLGLFNGILYLTSFILLQYTTKKNGVVLSTIFMKLGLLVPFLMSVLIFRESPSALQLVGFFIAVAAIVTIHFQKGTRLQTSALPLFLLLVLGGGANAMSKVFERLGTPQYSNPFLFYTFLSAFLLCAGLVILKKERPGWRDLLYGALIGIPNFIASKFLLMSLNYLPAVAAYPTFSVATILVVTLAGVLLFREKLNPRQWISLGAILAAVALLNI